MASQCFPCCCALVTVAWPLLQALNLSPKLSPGNTTRTRSAAKPPAAAAAAKSAAKPATTAAKPVATATQPATAAKHKAKPAAAVPTKGTAATALKSGRGGGARI